jgi:hypothetical protein
MKKVLLILALSFSVLLAAVGCNSDNTLKIWVGSESEEFYTQ